MKQILRAPARAAVLAAFLCAAAAAFPATVLVPQMELITHVATTGGDLALTTYGNLALSIDGGYKFGGSLVFGVSHDTQLESFGSDIPPSLQFQSAAMTMRSVFSLPLSISYFIGANDILASGDGFTQFGVAPIMTAYRGYLAFPSGPIYDGIYQVWGTGIHVEYVPKVETAAFDLYVYEDTHPTFPGGAASLITTTGAYSGDVRFLLNLEAVKLEAFVGGTYSAVMAPSGLFRGGVLFYASNRNVEFLAQIGVPLWNPVTDPAFNVNLFYLLVEPRLHLGALSIVPTFFWHPGGYMQAQNPDELGSFDVNLNIFAGSPATTPVQGGVESNVSFQAATGQFVLKASPWIGFATSGVQWTAKLGAKLLPFDVATMFDGFVGVRAEF
jgi:hypothetical protein